MRSNTLHNTGTEAHTPPVHAVTHRSKVVCIYCYRTLGMTGSARKIAQLLHAHECVEARLAKLPAAPVPYN